MTVGVFTLVAPVQPVFSDFASFQDVQLLAIVTW